MPLNTSDTTESDCRRSKSTICVDPSGRRPRSALSKWPKLTRFLRGIYVSNSHGNLKKSGLIMPFSLWNVDNVVVRVPFPKGSW